MALGSLYRVPVSKLMCGVVSRSSSCSDRGTPPSLRFISFSWAVIPSRGRVCWVIPATNIFCLVFLDLTTTGFLGMGIK